MLARVCILTNGACWNSGVARAETLILGEFAGLFGDNGVVFLTDGENDKFPQIGGRDNVGEFENEGFANVNWTM